MVTDDKTKKKKNLWDYDTPKNREKEEGREQKRESSSL